MDDTDRKILDYLKENGRAPFTDIADELGVSEGTVRNRVEKMQENGEIERFTVDLDLETSMEAIVMVDVTTERTISEIVEEFPRDLEISEVAGEHDLVVQIGREDREELNGTIDDIRQVDGVEHTLTFSVLKSYSR